MATNGNFLLFMIKVFHTPWQPQLLREAAAWQLRRGSNLVLSCCGLSSSSHLCWLQAGGNKFASSLKPETYAAIMKGSLSQFSSARTAAAGDLWAHQRTSQGAPPAKPRMLLKKRRWGLHLQRGRAKSHYLRVLNVYLLYLRADSGSCSNAQWHLECPCKHFLFASPFLI